MSKQKLRVKNTQLDNLISNLRGEVGEVVTSWLILQQLSASTRALSSNDFDKDLKNKDLTFVRLLKYKVADELVARLSELAEPKIGQKTFHFAAEKLGKLEAEVRAFRLFVIREKLQQKRNQDISHKELSEQWPEHGPIHIPYQTLVTAVAHALRLMKKIDRIVLGPAARFLWAEMRKRRYQILAPPCAAYMLVPVLPLSPETRQQVILEEMAEGRKVWSDMPATINGKQVTVSACREWGAFMFGGRMIVLPQYPLQKLEVEFSILVSAAAPTGTQGDPIAEREITAKYRVKAKEGDKRISFSPVSPVSRLETGEITELVDFHIDLNDTTRASFAQLNVGDEKEFTLGVRILKGYRQRWAKKA